MDVHEISDVDDPEGLDKAFPGSAKCSSNGISGLDMDLHWNQIDSLQRVAGQISCKKAVGKAAHVGKTISEYQQKHPKEEDLIHVVFLLYFFENFFLAFADCLRSTVWGFC